MDGTLISTTTPGQTESNGCERVLNTFQIFRIGGSPLDAIEPYSGNPSWGVLSPLKEMQSVHFKRIIHLNFMFNIQEIFDINKMKDKNVFNYSNILCLKIRSSNFDLYTNL